LQTKGKAFTLSVLNIENIENIEEFLGVQNVWDVQDINSDHKVQDQYDQPMNSGIIQ